MGEGQDRREASQPESKEYKEREGGLGQQREFQKGVAGINIPDMGAWLEVLKKGA